MEKRNYVKPVLNSETFVPQTYVAACYDFTAHLICAIPGRSAYNVNDGTTTRNDHGLCANEAVVNIKGSTGYEVEDGMINTNRPISGLTIGAEIAAGTTTGFSSNIGSNSGLENGKYYRAKWTSTDNENHTGSYSHYGRAYVTGVIEIPGRPNHS